MGTTYAYDALGQLVRVNDPHENATWVYNYDRGGNITSKVKYAYTTGALGAAVQTIPYTYGDNNWKDKLTSYNGQTITYDAIGNPLSDGTWTYTWQAGRQLQQMSKEGSFVSFKYDHNGLRTEKMVGENGVYTITSYTLHGKLITHMTVGEDKLHFFYDAQSRPAKVNFNGTMYTYLHNLQGDIVGILDSVDNLVVEYKYDAWGRPLSTTGSLAGTLGKCNPFRYRGYVYDEETGLYYLRSRYYNPDQNRFINADTRLDTRGFGANQFAYCGNHSVNRTDISGFAWYNDVWNWTSNAAADAWNWTTDAANNAWNWVKRTSKETWNSITSTATFVKNWVIETSNYVVERGKEFIATAKSLLQKKGVRIIKGIGGFAWGMYKAVESVIIGLGVNAVPLPAISQAASLGFAAKAGYHLSKAHQSLKDVINTIFFD